MKKTILSITFLTLALSLSAQVAIEKNQVSSGAILDFPTSATKGILLPHVDNYNTAGTESGTFVFNSADNKVYYRGETTWEQLTKAGQKTVTVNSSFSETDGKGMLITDKATSEDPKGVLELDSDSKALALPKVADVTKMPSPKSGTICFDMKSESLAVFNGTEWYFWR